MEGNWIKLHRKMLEWEWYDHTNTKVVFLHCLLKANYEKRSWRGIEINPGEFITSLESMASETGLTVKQVRTALDNLEMTKDIDRARSVSGSYTMIAIVSWGKYQDKGQDKDKLRASYGQGKGKVRASLGQAGGKLRASTKEGKEYKERQEGKEREEGAADFFETIKDAGTLKSKAIVYFAEKFDYEVMAEEGRHFDAILNNIKTILKKNKVPGEKITETELLEIFKLLCDRLPKFYQDKASPKIIRDNFGSIFTQIKTKHNATSVSDAKIREYFSE